MSGTDIFGKKPYKEIQVKSVKPDLASRYVLAIRTNADILSFSKMIYTETNYLFYISPDRFQAEELDRLSEFQSFIYKDIVSDNKVFYLQNTGLGSDKQILGYGNNALFQIRRKKKKRKNQISLSFEEEAADAIDFMQETHGDGIQNWHDFKADLAQKSVDVMGKIDYIFPLQMETYEIVKPLLQHFSKMQEINYMLLEPKQINDAVSFFMYMDLMMERINSASQKKYY
jgi:hypothetical protein